MEEKIEFIYDKTVRRPKRLENNVFILYAPERIRLQPWFLSFELYNKNLNKIFQIRKKQEIGYFILLNDAGKEIRHSFKKEH